MTLVLRRVVFFKKSFYRPTGHMEAWKTNIPSMEYTEVTLLFYNFRSKSHIRFFAGFPVILLPYSVAHGNLGLEFDNIEKVLLTMIRLERS